MYSRRWLINCTLVVMISILAWAGFHFDAERDRDRGQRISTLNPADVNSIELQFDKLQLSLQRHGDDWRITAPLDWSAHTTNVRRLLSILTVESDALADTDGINLASLGLQPPVASLRLNDTPLLFGATNNIGGRRYVMIESRLYLLPDLHLAFAAQGLAGMVERALLPRHGDIASLRLPGIDISRDSEDQLHSIPARSQVQLQQLLDNWGALPASRIRPYDAETSTGEVIELRFADGQGVDFRLLSSDPEIVIANPRIGLQYHFGAQYLDRLISPPADD